MVLSNLKVGEIAYITDIDTNGNIRARLNEMGLVKGTKITVLRVGINKSPIEITLRNFNLAVRKELADKIGVIYG